MKKLVVLIFLAFLFSCNKDVVFEDFPEDNLKSAKIITKNIVFKDMQGNFRYEANPGDATCPMYAFTSGTGNVTHLGKSHFQNKYCCNEFGTPIQFIEGYVQAANGDKFFTNPTGESIHVDGEQYGEFIIIGGTGRSENCSGEIYMTSKINWGTTALTAKGFGTISY